MDEAIAWLTVASWLMVAAYWLILDRYAKEVRELHGLLKEWNAELTAQAEQVEADAKTVTDLVVTALWHLEGNKETP